MEDRPAGGACTSRRSSGCVGAKVEAILLSYIGPNSTRGVALEWAFEKKGQKAQHRRDSPTAPASLVHVTFQNFTLGGLSAYIKVISPPVYPSPLPSALPTQFPSFIFRPRHTTQPTIMPTVQSRPRGPLVRPKQHSLSLPRSHKETVPNFC
jgi:hypothetical protein